MGYHVAIVRTRDGKAAPLSEEEVRALAGVFPGARIEPPSLKGAALDLVVRDAGAGQFRWLLQGGELWTSDPEDEEIESMIQAAAALGARVRGDEWETYRSASETFVHPDDRAQADRRQAGAAGLDRRRAVMLAIKIAAGAVFIAGLVVSYLRQ
jgi:hypothetical protein